jgi:hypothetical protein
LLVMLLLLASFIACPSNRFLGICGHLFSMNQLNILKTLIVNFGVLNDASTFFSSPSSYISFGVLVSVDCWMFSLGELVVFSTIIYATITSISSSTKSST